MVGARWSFRIFPTQTGLQLPDIFLHLFCMFSHCSQQMKPLVFKRCGSGLGHESVLLLIELDVFKTEKMILCNNLWGRLSPLEITSLLALKNSFCSLQLSTDFTIKKPSDYLYLIPKMFILSLTDCLHFTTKKPPADYLLIIAKMSFCPLQIISKLTPKIFAVPYRSPKVF